MARTKSTRRKKLRVEKHEMEQQETTQTSQKSGKVVVHWEFLDKVWIPYDEHTSKLIEAEYQKNKQSFISFTGSNGQQYLITFGDMMQENLRTNFRRQVRRVEQKMDEDDEMQDVLEVTVDHSGFDGILKYFGKKEFSDFVFHVGERDIFVHKCILCARSKIFEQMISSKTEMHVDEEYDIFLQLLKYLYCGKITLKEENARKFLDISVRYRISELKDECYNFLLKGMDMDEFGQIFISEKKRRRTEVYQEESNNSITSTSDENSVTDRSPPQKKVMMKESENSYLKKRSHDEMEIDTVEHPPKRQKTDYSMSEEFLLKCLKHMSKYEDIVSFSQFKELDENQLLKLIQSDDFCVDEIDLLKSIVEWGKQRCKDQEKHSDLPQVLKNLLPHIRFPLIPTESLITFVKPLNIISEDTYMESLEYNVCPEEFAEVKSPLFTLRNSSFKGNTIMSISHTRILMKWLNKTTHKNKEWELCYKASKHGWAARDFHRHCDNIGPTVVVIKSTSGCIFGGFNPDSWSSNNQYSKNPESFLFTLVNKAGIPPSQFHPIDKSYGTAYNGYSYGPTFGEGHDLFVCSSSNTLKSSYSHLGCTYDVPAGMTTQNAKSLFAGTKKFTCSEIEIFKIIKNEQKSK